MTILHLIFHLALIIYVKNECKQNNEGKLMVILEDWLSKMCQTCSMKGVHEGGVCGVCGLPLPRSVRILMECILVCVDFQFALEIS